MIISNILVTETRNTVRLSADMHFEKETSENLFIEVPKRFKSFLYRDASPFLAAALLPCMKRNENIVVKGTIAKTQLQRLNKIMQTVIDWNVGFNKIEVSVDGLTDENSQPKYSGSFFTAGVDSFYTFLKNKKSITHLLLIHGCDIPLKDKTFFTEVESRIGKIARAENVTLLQIKTNMRDIIEPRLEWEWELGSALSAISLTLRNGLKQVFIPSGMHFNEVCPYGTHPDFDPLWSTANQAIIHDGCEATRLDKVFAISHSKTAMQNLRVCCHIIRGKYNCNVCFKCLQTKIELVCANALQKAETFDKRIDLAAVRKTYYNVNLHFNAFGENALAYLRENNIQPELQEALAESLQRSKHPSLLRKSADYIAYLDKTYNKRRLYSLIFSINDKDDRTIFFKWISNMGLVK